MTEFIDGFFHFVQLSSKRSNFKNKFVFFGTTTIICVSSSIHPGLLSSCPVCSGYYKRHIIVFLFVTPLLIKSDYEEMGDVRTR